MRVAFVSIVCVFRNSVQANVTALHSISQLALVACESVEIIVVDNSSYDTSASPLGSLTAAAEIPDLHVYTVSKKIDDDSAVWIGLEHAIGDYVLVVDLSESLSPFLNDMFAAAAGGADVVMALPQRALAQSYVYRLASMGFRKFYKLVSGEALPVERPLHQLLTRRVVNYLGQSPYPIASYRHLPVAAGFSHISITRDVTLQSGKGRSLLAGVAQGLNLLMSTTQAPMRLLTWLSVFAMVANLAYSIYVLSVAFLKVDVAPGWVSISLQQSGMFFLISLGMLILGEYALKVSHTLALTKRRYIVRQFSSDGVENRQRLNVDENVGASYDTRSA